MSDQSPTAELTRTWIAVTDADGRARLEARWTARPEARPAVAAHAA